MPRSHGFRACSTATPEEGLGFEFSCEGLHRDEIDEVLSIAGFRGAGRPRPLRIGAIAFKVIFFAIGRLSKLRRAQTF